MPKVSLPGEPRKGKLTWTRGELTESTGLCYKTIINLEARGLLQRVEIGLKSALYTNASVMALFGGGK